MGAEATRRLLILDDEPAVAQTVAFAAQRHGFSVRMSASTEEFFDDVERFAPSHIIIDLLMPGMDGVEVLRSLAETRCRANIIMMSGMGTKVLESAQRVGIERGLCIGGILPQQTVQVGRTARAAGHGCACTVVLRDGGADQA